MGIKKEKNGPGYDWSCINWRSVMQSADDGVLWEEVASSWGVPEELHPNFYRRCVMRDIDFADPSKVEGIGDLKYVQEWRRWEEWRKDKAEMSRAGRKSTAVWWWYKEGPRMQRKISEDQIAKFFYHLERGCPKKLAADAAGFSVKFVERRQKEDEDFAQRIQQAMASPRTGWIGAMHTKALSGDTDAAKFLISKDPITSKEYTVEENRNISVNFTFNREALMQKYSEKFALEDRVEEAVFEEVVDAIEKNDV